MKNVTIKYLLLLSLLLVFSQTTSASNIDKVYTKSISQTWGERFKSIFQRSDFNKSYAIVIGVSRFDDFQNLGTTQDPIRMKDYLLNEAGFDYVRLITGNQVNLNKIRSIMLNEMPNTLKPNDRFLFYWSGHGATNNVNGNQFGYLPVANSANDDFASMLSMSDLSQWDSQLNITQSFYLLDACFSGLARGFQVQNDNRAQTLQQIARPSRQILTAGAANEETIVIDRLGGSVFTKAVIDGLRGAADAEFRGLGRDGIVSARELQLYVQRSVAKEAAQAGWNKPITPLLWNASSRSIGDFFFFTDKTVAPVTAIQPHQPKAGITTQSSSHTQSQQKQAIKLPQQAPDSIPTPRNIIRLPNNLNLVRIPPGTFQMGSNDHPSEQPIHTVTINYPFWMSQTEITFAQYDTYTSVYVDVDKPDDEGWGRGNRPVINVNYFDILDYIKWINRTNREGLSCRLPSETEWEYAARAGTNTRFYWGSHIKNKANCSDCLNPPVQKTLPVASFPPNNYYLYDMHGNVSEITADCEHENYMTAPSDGSPWLINCDKTLRRGVARGGNWSRASINTDHTFNTLTDLRSSSRSFPLQGSPRIDERGRGIYSYSRSNTNGFRLVCTRI